MVQYKNKKYLIIVFYVIILIAGFGLRIPHYADWIDEIKLFEIVRLYDNDGLFDGIKKTYGREVIPAALCHIFGLATPQQMRWLFVLAGVAMILMPLVIKYKNAILLMLFIAFNPLLIYWSMFARPYILAALLVMLAWRWPLLLIPAVLTNPIAIIGANLLKKKWIPFYIILAVVTWIYYKQMPLSESGHCYL